MADHNAKTQWGDPLSRQADSVQRQPFELILLCNKLKKIIFKSTGPWYPFLLTEQLPLWIVPFFLVSYLMQTSPPQTTLLCFPVRNTIELLYFTNDITNQILRGKNPDSQHIFITMSVVQAAFFFLTRLIN